MKRLLLATLLCATLPAVAGDLPSLPAIGQDRFRKLSEDLGAALSYKGVTPATSLGIAGFDVGVEISATDIKNSDLFGIAGNSAPDYIAVPKVHFYKGLPWGIDVGGFIGAASNLDATLYGADARYAILDDGIATPAVAVRLSGTRTSDIGSLRVSTIAGDVMVSKRLTLATPYIGAGVVRTISEAKGTALAEEDFNTSRFFVGLNLNFAIVNVAFEAEKMGSNTTLSAKAGWRF
jgi:hypothetical protein